MRSGHLTFLLVNKYANLLICDVEIKKLRVRTRVNDGDLEVTLEKLDVDL